MTVQKVMQDKILLALVMIAILGIFVGSFTPGNRETKHSSKTAESIVPSAQPISKPENPSYPANAALDPNLATDFVKWWMTGAFDYSSASAAKSHAEIMHWMTPEAQKTLQATFWTPEMASGIAQRRIVAAFQPTNVQAQAINPDGTVVVVISGTLVFQANGRPITQQILADVQVRKDLTGLRVIGLYNHSGPAISSSVY